MTPVSAGILYRIVDWFLTVLPVDASGRRVFDETMADWRRELALATSRSRRFVVHARSTAAVVGTLWHASSREASQALKSTLVPRLATVTAVWLVGTVWFNGLPVDPRFFVAAPAGLAWTLAGASIAAQVALAFPLLVFVAEVIGRRSRETPTLGPLVLLVSCGLVLTLVVLPSTMVFIAHERWSHFANAAQPAPSLTAMWFSFPHFTAAAISSTAVAALFLVANGIRRVGGLVGWSVGLGPAIGLLVSLVVILFVVPFPVVRPSVMLTASVAMMAVLILSADRLARIAAARSASTRQLSSPQIVNSK